MVVGLYVQQAPGRRCVSFQRLVCEDGKWRGGERRRDESPQVYPRTIPANNRMPTKRFENGVVFYAATTFHPVCLCAVANAVRTHSRRQHHMPAWITRRLRPFITRTLFRESAGSTRVARCQRESARRGSTRKTSINVVIWTNALLNWQ